MAERIIGSCGIVCTECGAFIARQRGDKELQRQTAAEWSKMYGAEIPPEAVDCDGCHAEGGVQIGHCAECEIRRCAQADHGVTTCAECAEYPCDRISAFFRHVPSARKELDGLKAAL